MKQIGYFAWRGIVQKNANEHLPSKHGTLSHWANAITDLKNHFMNSVGIRQKAGSIQIILFAGRLADT